MKLVFCCSIIFIQIILIFLASNIAISNKIGKTRLIFWNPAHEKIFKALKSIANCSFKDILI